jgi:hypothetical protein
MEINILATSSANSTSLVICPGKQVMDNWIHDNLTGEETITNSPTGYTNNIVIIQYLDHLLMHTSSGPTKPWKMLLLDGHITHEYPEFVIKAIENHIIYFEFPSHLTHALQPLDVGVFWPWKHYQNQAIQYAIRSLDFEYSITSFFRDLTSIREKTMKSYTIKSTFQESGMWLVSCKAGLKKMRQYSKPLRRKALTDNDNSDDEPELPPLPPPPTTYFEFEIAIEEWLDRGPPKEYSSPSKQRFTDSLKATKVHLGKAILIDHEHRSIQTKLFEETKRKTTSRRSIHRGGEIKVSVAREKKRVRDENEKIEAIQKARKRITTSYSVLLISNPPQRI